MDEERIDRNKKFKDFQNDKQNFFEKKKTDLGKYKRFDDYYTFHVCPKGRNGGISDRLFEVFYGNRHYNSETYVRSDLSLDSKSLIENGCTLSFAINDHGYVAVMLYPGKTPYTRQEETCIFFENYLNPKKLFNTQYLDKLWRFFNSYMEVTSIDGKPTLMDKWRVWYLRNFKNKVIDEKYLPKSINSWVITLLKYVLTVGLSGFVFSKVIMPDNSGTDNLKIEYDKLKAENIELNLKLQYERTVDSLKNLIPKNK